MTAPALAIPASRGTETRAYARVAQALTEAGSRKSGSDWQCPAHDDGSPSLSVTRNAEGVLLYCHAGCATEDVVAALRLTMADLYDEPREKRERPRVVAEYPYCDERGELLLTVKRIEPGYNGERKTFRQFAANGTPKVSGIRRVLYRLPEVVAAAQAGGPVFVVEGEKDVEALRSLEPGITATCNVGGAGKWRDEYTASLRGAEVVYVIADRDEPGRKHAAQVAASLARAGVPFQILEPGSGKDVSDHLAAGLGFDQLVPVDQATTEPEQNAAEEVEPNPAPRRPRGLLPEEFWASRETLRHIRQAGHHRNRSGDVAFYSTLTRLSGMVPHYVKADTGIGDYASLNTFAAIVASSGQGKSSGVAAARRLLTPPPDLDFRDGLPIGSGEGISETFMGTTEEETGEMNRKGEPIMRTVRAQVRHNAFFNVDEGVMLTRLMQQRSGSTLGETLRSAFVGVTLGHTNASKETNRFIPSGSYSMGLLVGFQPETAAPLFDEIAEGTPQRFLWGTAADPSIPDKRVDWPGELTAWRTVIGIKTEQHITFDEGIRERLWREDLERARGNVPAEDIDPLDAHAPLILVKVSSLLAILEGRTHVTAEDWALAEMVWQASCEARAWVIECSERKRAEEAEKRTQARVLEEVRVARELADDAEQRADKAVDRVARRIAVLVHTNGPMSRSDIRKRLAGRDKPHTNVAIEHADARGWVTEKDRKITPGESRPR